MATKSSDIVHYLRDRSKVTREATPCESVGPAALSPGHRGCFSFAGRDDTTTRDSLRATASSLVLVLPEHLDSCPADTTVIAVESPRLEFARLVAYFFGPPRQPGVHPTAVIDSSARVGRDPQIGVGVVVGANCLIGDRVTIGPNAVIHDSCVIGDDVIIGPGSVLGFTGFGYAREADGTPILIPHLGSVTIGDRVEIGANTAIDRGTLENTVIEDDVKIDNLVHIAHNCKIGAGSFVIATAILCGGVRVGENVWISPNVAIREQLKVGENSVVGLSSTVIHDVKPNTVVVGSPARDIGGR